MPAVTTGRDAVMVLEDCRRSKPHLRLDLGYSPPFFVQELWLVLRAHATHPLDTDDFSLRLEVAPEDHSPDRNDCVEEHSVSELKDRCTWWDVSALVGVHVHAAIANILLHHIHESRREDRIEQRERLVEDYDLRVHDERSADAD